MFLNLILSILNSIRFVLSSRLGSLAKRQPNEQGQTQLTPSVSDRHDSVCVCVCLREPPSLIRPMCVSKLCKMDVHLAVHVFLVCRRRRAFHL